MDCGVMKLNDKRLDVDDCSLYPGEFIPADRTGDGSPTAAAAAYTIPELGDFAVDRQVSLALGLRHCEGDVLTISGGTHNRRDDGAASSVAPDAMDYHCIDPGNQRHRFSNSNPLHDFVV
ncbi:hypothetical protein L1049_025923 [Liquidambar formosana]|uniref:Uncharacterized protein n=1 Tax=Liquidambar formosana TaxID=63359 RepID=A0AAP0R6T2_LIQFO